MIKIYNIISLVVLSMLFSGSLNAEKLITGPNHSVKANNSTARISAAGCLPSTANTQLDINNVRARINAGGDMWWDLQGISKYELPKGSTKTLMYSGSLWLGGKDVNGQLKGAFQRYRANGNDFWTGPLTTDGTASITQDVCSQYDKHFVIYRSDVDNFLLKYNNPDYPDYVVPNSIKDWPANGDVSRGQSQWLAPFVDLNGDGIYEWEQGEYPYYDIKNDLCKPKKINGVYEYAHTPEGGILADQVLKGDQTVWWVFNDNGNVHSESKGDAIGVEIRAQAFAFSTNDEINNMTFYSYEIINRSTYRLTDTYFSQWVDTDLGYAFDDYVGCDVKRGLGYCYNGKAIDGNGLASQYGAQPPAVGVDFFQGPYMDPDGIDNPKYDSTGKQIVDESINGVNFGDSIPDNERFGMRKFIYHINAATGPTSDPTKATEYYNYLIGIWRDGTQMTYGGTAHLSGGPVCDFMFPDLTDEWDWGTAGVVPANKKWTEETAKTQPGDRRFMQSAGPFTLESGAINYITVGIPYARATTGGPFASVELLRKVDDKAQALFDNCFKVLDGPDAPELVSQELDKKIVLYLKNLPSSNNANEDYKEEDVTITALNDDSTHYDPYYRFQGYQIYQLANSEVSMSELDNPDKARLVATSDLKDSITDLVNYVYDDKLQGNIPELKAEGKNTGIQHSFVITEDKFATGNTTLINDKKYYFAAIAYASNMFLPYSQDPATLDGLKGQRTPYLSGRKSATGPIKIHTLMPHAAPGVGVNSQYGTGPMITRLDGRGNGGLDLELTTASKAKIFTENQAEQITYENGRGPINVKVIDPLNVQAADYVLKFVPAGSVDTARWELYKNGNLLKASEYTIQVENEQLFLEEGLSIEITQQTGAGDITKDDNGYISSSITYSNPGNMWLGGLADNDAAGGFQNWIRSGTLNDKTNPDNNDYEPAAIGNPATWLDPQGAFEKLIGGTWAPYRLGSKYKDGPTKSVGIKSNKLSNLESVDIVYTSDKSKWTRCPVIETGEDAISAMGGVGKFGIRASKSIDKDGNYASAGSGSDMNNENAANYISENGMGWFPGYAISVETGERLNIIYGESSWLVGENGADMKFNPTSNYVTPAGEVLLGGKHFLYILRHSPDANGCPAYDKGEWTYNTLKTNSNNVFKEVMWTNIPMAKTQPKWLDNDAVIRLRVDKPYEKDAWNTQNTGVNSTAYNQGYPAYGFNTGNIAAVKGDKEIEKTALDLIRVVPNPYYAYSDYETNQVDNRVRITNLPERCDITIYTTNGILVRKFRKDDSGTILDWDLKNQANIPIASGIYYIHIDAPNIGEKVVKWFGVMRTVDLNAF